MLDTRFIPTNPFKITINEELKESQTPYFRNDTHISKSDIDEIKTDKHDDDLSFFSQHKRKKTETVSQLFNDEKNSSSEKEISGRWTEQEHMLFVEAIKKYGKNWKIIEKIVRTRTPTQLRSHAQKFFTKIMQTYNTIDPINYIKENVGSLEQANSPNNDQAERKQTEIDDAINITSDSCYKECEAYWKELNLRMMDKSLNEEKYKSYVLNYLTKLLMQGSSTNPSIGILSLLLKSKIFAYEQLNNSKLSMNLRNFFNYLYSDLQTKLNIMKFNIKPTLNSLFSDISIKKSKNKFLSTSFQINDAYKTFKLKQYFP